MAHQYNETPPRHPRGSYAKLICLNCRSRKIKCILPEDRSIEPSLSPQPPERACTRCQQQGLDCIVDKTVLGRPSQKRHRPEQMKAEEEPVAGRSIHDEPELDPDVQDFVLSDLRDEVHEIDTQISLPSRTKPSKHEIFEPLMDATHLFSALMSRDLTFGVSAFGSDVESNVDVTKLVSEGLAVLMDEHLVWHRLHSPYLPTLADLRRQLLSDPGVSFVSSTRTLFALLSLISLDVPSHRLRVSASLWQQLQGLVNTYCQKLLFAVPVHRHALYVLDLVDSYKPLAFASTRSVAAISIKGNLSTTLAKRTAQKLGFDTAADRLEILLSKAEDSSPEAIRALTLEALQWCRWLMLESIIDGYVMKSSPEQRGPLPESRKILSVVKKAVEVLPMPPAILFTYHHLSSAIVEMQAAVAGKQNWLNLTALAKLIDSHSQKCESHREYIHHLLERCDRSNNLHVEEEIKAVKRLRETDLNASHVRIAGLSMFYGLMSGLRLPGTKPQEITPDEAMQTSSEIITNLKEKHDTLSDPASIGSFISKYGDSRFAKQEQTLRDFVQTADSFQLQGISYTPPSIPVISMLLQTCREIVENNNTRLKGWGGMHPNVDIHLLLLQDVAKRLDAMDAAGGGPDAIAKGSIYASGAKLVRSLCSIVAGWRKTIIEREVKEAAEMGTQAAMPNEFEEVEEWLSGNLLDDWNDWPQAEDLDFSELLADGLEWVDWGQLTGSSEGSGLA